MERIFKAEKMLERIKKEGKQNMLDEETKKLILKLDGKKGNDYNFMSVVHNEQVVWIEDPEMPEKGIYVALCDCE